MLFNSSEFLVFFPIVVFLFFLIPAKIKYIWLLIASYYFYMSWNAKYAALLFFSTFVTYICGRLIQWIRDRKGDETQAKWRMKLTVAGSLILNLGILFCFKYFNWAAEVLQSALAFAHISVTAPRFDVVLPVGISFYTFQALGYTIDVYRGELRAEKNFLRYALFVSFFPQLVAGPIERSKNLLTQLQEVHSFDWDRAVNGLKLMLWGFFMKLVIADRAAIFVDAVYKDPKAYPGMFLAVATILFAFQIYCDFSGYSTIAKGAAMVLGIYLMDNFKAPYLTRSVTEFWRNWHISLSGWFRDYLYIPLGGNRKGRVRKYINILIVFCVSGLWHGAAGNFLVWGGLNGLYQIVEDGIKAISRKIHRNGQRVKSVSTSLRQILVTFLLVDFSWIFFRTDSFMEGVEVIKSICTMRNFGILLDGTLYTAGLAQRNFLILLLSILLLLVVDYMHLKGIHALEWLSRQEWWFRWGAMLGLFWLVILLGIYGVNYDAGAFIYFQF